jgi:glutathione S-transferase
MISFYYGSGSPYAWRVWLALEHKALPYELKVLSFSAGDTRKPEFVALNARHKVPTIVDDGFVLYESAVILEYLEERYPERALLPAEPRPRLRTSLSRRWWR